VLAVSFHSVGLFFFSCTQFQNRECGHLSAQRLDQPDDIMGQSPRRRPTDRDCGIWAAALQRMRPYRVLPKDQPSAKVGVRSLHAGTVSCIILLRG
jgi:hypothetical protein